MCIMYFVSNIKFFSLFVWGFFNALSDFSIISKEIDSHLGKKEF